MSKYTQGVCHDGAAILKDGQPLTIEQILEGLRERDHLKSHAETVADAVGFDANNDNRFNASVQAHCIENMKHFSDHLHAIEREFFMVPGEPDEDYPDEAPDDECLMNCWGSTTEQYVEQFRAALNRRDALSQAWGIREACNHILSMGSQTHLGILKHDRYMYISTRELRERADALFQKAEAQQ